MGMGFIVGGVETRQARRDFHVKLSLVCKEILVMSMAGASQHGANFLQVFSCCLISLSPKPF